ncbi:Z1 domain-containing protein [Pseudolactococcus reticulitermitis]|uniref:Endonuclease Z1 domain-containing protein n=1 Tax=Pseudolactococcus reticulitermitis TaxID=2025039 RepID=A0A224XAG4_9LACT|nr:Z1 domain-containing protein [Lactococcus reticulitermitis]GAX46705.1 hypothetical protein RsY01_284 [Lactococcus reticulitermitis]
MIDYEKIAQYEEIALAAISVGEDNPEYSVVENILKQYNAIWQLDDKSLVELSNRIYTKKSVSLDEDTILTSNPNANWFVDSRFERGTERFDAYHKYLENVEGYSLKVINSISTSMDKVMNNVGDPFDKEDFSKKGLVIGDVQSGKTGNFIALMNKAADAGYNMIVVTTGTIEKLRRQTQERIEYGFSGISSSVKKSEKRTVADFGNKEQSYFVTNKDKDFSIKYANPVNLGQVPIVAVIKKNKTSLENLALWLENGNKQDIKRFGKIEKSVLFIDDEADNATINTKDADSPTTINKGIRAILNLFKRSSYVGFTATPFANVFIDHTEEDDLFPSDFIQVLKTPSNYMGASTIFPEKGEYHHILNTNDDAETEIPIVIPKERRGDFIIEELPESLKEAIKIFFLQNAIRDLRGDKKKHRSMLVNVSHLNYIQQQVKELISEEVFRLKTQIKNYILTEQPIKVELFELFEKEFPKIAESFESVQKQLSESIDAIEVDVINAKNKSFNYEDYPNGARIIAVGGFALSRGLTLEGLSTSYLYRNTLMYDTLMQMGRWFGYRPNYDDLIKLYMPNQSIEWYSQILDATEDLKKQIKRMANEHQTPKEFGIYIKQAEADEVRLLITAGNKMRNARDHEVTVKISGDYRETTKLDVKSVKQNRQTVETWISEYQERFDETHLWKNADKELVKALLANYLYGNFNKLNSQVVAETLKHFKTFDVKIAYTKADKPRKRAFRYNSKHEVIAFANSRVGSSGDGKFALTEEQKESHEFKSEKDYFSKFREDERNPLVIIYPEKLSFNKENKNSDTETEKFYQKNKDNIFWAIALGVPELADEKTISYKTKLNTVMQQQMITGEQLDLFSSADETEEDLE